MREGARVGKEAGARQARQARPDQGMDDGYFGAMMDDAAWTEYMYGYGRPVQVRL